MGRAPQRLKTQTLFFRQPGEHNSIQAVDRLKTSARQIILKKKGSPNFCLVKIVKIFLGVSRFKKAFEITLVKNEK